MTKFNLELSSKEALAVAVAVKLLAAEARGPKYAEDYTAEAIEELVGTCNELSGRLGAQAAKHLMEKLADLVKSV